MSINICKGKNCSADLDTIKYYEDPYGGILCERCIDRVRNDAIATLCTAIKGPLYYAASNQFYRFYEFCHEVSLRGALGYSCERDLIHSHKIIFGVQDTKDIDNESGDIPEIVPPMLVFTDLVDIHNIQPLSKADRDPITISYGIRVNDQQEFDDQMLRRDYFADYLYSMATRVYEEIFKSFYVELNTQDILFERTRLEMEQEKIPLFHSICPEGCPDKCQAVTSLSQSYLCSECSNRENGSIIYTYGGEKLCTRCMYAAMISYIIQHLTTTTVDMIPPCSSNAEISAWISKYISLVPDANVYFKTGISK